MPMQYRILVSQKNLGATIHTATCPVVSNKGPREGVWERSAATAEALLTEWDEENDVTERGLPPTRICKCTGERA